MTTLGDVLADGYVLDLEDDFGSNELDRSLWHPHYLPQWSSRARSTARYELTDSTLHLRIDQDQAPWCPEFDGDTRVSSLQTGVFAGPVGSTLGQHRFDPRVVVREEQPVLRLYTPQYGVFVIRAAVPADPACMASLWMIGYEDQPEHSAEICVFEIFGRDISEDATAVGVGLHPFADPAIENDFEQIVLPLDARELHTYAVEWGPTRTTFFVDAEAIKVVEQSPSYPMQFMLGIYEFGSPSAGPYPKRFIVDSFSGYRPVA